MRKPGDGFRMARILVPLSVDGVGCGEILSGFAGSKRASSKAGLFTEGRDRETYFLGAIASFAALATRNFTTVLALI